jgi:hypothetical protein
VAAIKLFAADPVAAPNVSAVAAETSQPASATSGAKAELHKELVKTQTGVQTSRIVCGKRTGLRVSL